jgi:hypothetical protein
MTYSPTTVSAKRLRVGDPFKVRSAGALATNLAPVRPRAQVPKLLLGSRGWNPEWSSIAASELDVPSWRARFLAVSQCDETLRWLDKGGLDQQQRRTAQPAVARMHVWRRRNLVAGRSHKPLSIAGPLTRSPRSGVTGQTAVTTLARRSAEGF